MENSDDDDGESSLAKGKEKKKMVEEWTNPKITQVLVDTMIRLVIVISSMGD
ncbi:hypothetical protein ABW19_dt0200663 [Dactylella cylindrospora]|nr:hypothetical protein ABW19_dt0200663 [Dactylella cylindrospora]